MSFKAVDEFVSFTDQTSDAQGKILSRLFNGVLYIAHFYLEGVQMLHCMDMAKIVSAAHAVKRTGLDETVFGFKSF